MTSLVLTLALAVAIGVSLGLLGGGGSILAVPLLIYVTGLPVKEAIATSLFVVGVTSAVALVPYAWERRVRWRTGLVLGLAGMAGAYGGGRLAEVVPGTALVSVFALMMLATAVGMIRGRHAATDEPGESVGRELSPVRTIAVGATVGVVAGLVGAGGGFLVVPALTLLGGLPMAVAVGTSLAVISMQSLAGFAGHLAAVAVDWTLTAALTGAAVAGSLVGSRLSRRVPERRLRPAFGWFVLAVGVLVLGQQLPALAS
ncbi:sulfite exporter TauE/SafE family protein [Micromonospora orduensis]|uniref:Probable membrane transporter protein n=1 Tax=Micromonospora orduensis TaxID=1420891 RepID=A0A5C4QRU6_9ACTN|nr:sulfite exporter TauE/SafE family protein [Micromonospora orduensis]TNH29481.1 sulfite exporter TauE/SafE family protein [Micromonospora orduensis]